MKNHPGEIVAQVRRTRPPRGDPRCMTPATYRIVVRGRLGDRFASAFDGMALESKDGKTLLVGVISDQAQLHGVLARLRDFGLELVRLEQVEP